MSVASTSTVLQHVKAPATCASDQSRKKQRNILPWGLAFVAAHLLAIASGIINPLSAHATGTLTVHSWFIGWLISYKIYGLHCKFVRFEAAIVLCALFQLAVGAAAFSRVYYGPLLGHEHDLFQGLSALYIKEEQWIPPSIVNWWVESSHSRYTGLGWWICELADILAHQGPFALMCRILAKEAGGWSHVTASVARSWYLSILAGPLHRICWDFCTCGESFCDGPYRGFLKRIRNHEQLFWHAAPCLVLVVFLLLLNKARRGHGTAVQKILWQKMTHARHEN